MEETQRQWLIRIICELVLLSGLRPEEYQRVKRRLEKTKVDVLLDILGTGTAARISFQRKTPEVTAA